MSSSSPAPSSQPVVSVQSLGSGSSGNAFLVTAGATSLLLDCGVGIRTIRRALKERDLVITDLDAVLVTHEHTDHIRTLGCVTGTDVPIISTLGTARRGNIPPPQWERIEFHQPLRVGAIDVWAIMVRHDAAEPCGYLLEANGVRVSVFTDLGSWHDRLASPIAASQLVVLESNHDLDMLQRGPYPMHLKRRVASEVGHLSNADCGTALASTLRSGHQAPDIWLAHLSATNNAPEVAEQATRTALTDADLELPVLALPRTEPGPVWTSQLAGSSGGFWQPALLRNESRQLSMETLFR